MCVTFVVFTDYESCRRPISTNSRSMEARAYGLTRGTCFLAWRLELDAVAGLLWISWCVLGGADFFSVFFSIFFSFERTRPASSMKPPGLIYIITSNEVVLSGKKTLHNEARPRERNDRGRFCL